jgi:type III secretion protein L
MSKFFTLIRGDKIHTAPGTKVLPADTFSSLLDAQGVLSTVKEDAKRYRIDVAKGYEAGFAEWANHLAELEREIERVHTEIQKVIVPLALKAAKKIVGREIELTPTTTVDIVSNSMKAVAQHKKIIIYVNKKDLEVLEANKERLKKGFEHLESFSLRDRNDILPGGCIIETEAGIINAQIANKWTALEAAFASLIHAKHSEKGS